LRRREALQQCLRERLAAKTCAWTETLGATKRRRICHRRRQPRSHMALVANDR